MNKKDLFRKAYFDYKMGQMSDIEYLVAFHKVIRQGDGLTWEQIGNIIKEIQSQVGNVIIANFMGYEYVGDEHFHIHEHGYMDSYSDLFVDHFHINELEFNTNWSWLMPVVEKLWQQGRRVEINPNIKDVYEKVVEEIGRKK